MRQLPRPDPAVQQKRPYKLRFFSPLWAIYSHDTRGRPLPAAAHQPQQRDMTMSELLDIIIRPLTGDSPCGENVSYDTDFDVIKREINKLSGIDCSLIDTTARRILAEKSKDLRVLSFLAFACLRGERWAELADVFEGMTRLVAAHFDGLYPERPRARHMALRWLSEQRFTDALEQSQPSPDAFEHVERLANALESLKPMLEQRFPDGAPFPSGLYAQVSRWRTACKPAPAPTVQSPAAPRPAEGAPDEQAQTPSQAQAAVRKAAMFLIEKEPSRPGGYRLLRAARWDQLRTLPPSDSGKTRLEGPNEQMRNSLRKLLADEDWTTLLNRSEQAFAGKAHHFWLDLQRFSYTACTKLGGEYAAVAEAIAIETAMLLRRVPELSSMAFSDGTTMCDPATVDWVEAVAMRSLGMSDSAGGAPAANDQSSAFETERRAVNELVGSGKAQEALVLLQQAIRASSDEQLNFRRKVLIGATLLHVKKVHVAVAVLETLTKAIDYYHLEHWAPDLAGDALVELFRAYGMARKELPPGAQSNTTDRRPEVLAALSRVDPVRACSLKL
ncbi:MAG: type VI secretion system protein TssA [Chitinivibrionales bacterium]|nr:type VI secretion system protein TssA [Chitinivibrionales bacterium]